RQREHPPHPARLQRDPNLHALPGYLAGGHHDHADQLLRRDLPMSRHHPASAMLGFSLVEVMVALIIICVGLLGIAKLQALMLTNTGASRTQALAALEASSIAATMHADRKYWAGAAPATTTTVNDIVGSVGITSTDAVLQTSPDCMLHGADWPCSSAKIAAYDLQNWMGDMSTTLPGSKT